MAVRDGDEVPATRKQTGWKKRAGTEGKSKSANRDAQDFRSGPILSMMDVTGVGQS